MARRFLILWLLLFLGCRAYAEQPEISIKEVVSGYILKSTNGDLLALYGIECPSPDDPIGVRSKELTATIVRDAETKVIVKSKQYGVTNVDIVTGDNVSLSELLLREGLARWDKATALDEPNLRDAEESAKKNGVGLWQHANDKNQTVEGSTQADSRPTVVLKGKGDPLRAEQSRQHWNEVLYQRSLAAEKAKHEAELQQQQMHPRDRSLFHREQVELAGKMMSEATLRGQRVSLVVCDECSAIFPGHSGSQECPVCGDYYYSPPISIPGYP